MPERRPPPTPPTKKPAAPQPSQDSTIVVDRPEIDSKTGDAGDGDVFSGPDATKTAMPRPAKGAPAPSTASSADVSLIEAKELPSSEGFAIPRTNAFEDFHPATEVLKLAFSDPGADDTGPHAQPPPPVVSRLTPPAPRPTPASAKPPTVSPVPGRAEAAALQKALDSSALETSSLDLTPVEVRKWKIPREGAPAAPAAAPVANAPSGVRALPLQAQAAPPPAPAEPRDDGTRVDLGPAAAAAVAAAAAQSAALPFDVDELRRNLEEAEKLLKTVKTQVAGLDIEARGLNAQLAAALHRLSEAVAMLKR